MGAACVLFEYLISFYFLASILEKNNVFFWISLLFSFLHIKILREEPAGF